VIAIERRCELINCIYDHRTSRHEAFSIDRPRQCVPKHFPTDSPVLFIKVVGKLGEQDYGDKIGSPSGDLGGQFRTANGVHRQAVVTGYLVIA
jgi:hypothetical protein